MKKILFHLFCLSSVIMCVMLGIWQIDRMQWKEALIWQVEKYRSTPAEDFMITDFNQDRDLFKKVYLFGAFLNDYEMLLQAKYFDESREQETLGYHIITPFVTTEGIVVFVNRGWIPEQYKDKMSRPKSLPTSFIEAPIEGIIRESKGKEPWYMPHNEPQKDLWFWIDIDSMTKRLQEVSAQKGNGLQNIQPILIQQTVTTNIDGFKYPIALSGDIEFYNQHMTYIITWFAMAFAITGMWIWWSRSGNK